jgi:hypothetical protein
MLVSCEKIIKVLECGPKSPAFYLDLEEWKKDREIWFAARKYAQKILLRFHDEAILLYFKSLDKKEIELTIK